MPLPPNGKSILMTPDPYHTPGYGGFCPQIKYRIGETFGKTTNKLLKDLGVASSGKLVLAEIGPSSLHLTRSEQERSKLLRRRVQSWGDQKLMESMIPGYTGFIPKSEHFFGNRYAVNCQSAIAEFEGDQRKHKEKLKELRLLAAMQSGMTPDDKDKLPAIKTRYTVPLQPIANEPKTYASAKPFFQPASPYYLPNDDPQKNYMSGYTGFVPRSRGQLGMGYPIITHMALNEFTDDIKRHQGVMSKDVSVERPKTRDSLGRLIYPVETGLVPHYTGHIPGQKFRYGQTFGHSTENALKQEVTMSI